MLTHTVRILNTQPHTHTNFIARARNLNGTAFAAWPGGIYTSILVPRLPVLGEKGIRLAQNMHVGPCIPVGVQLLLLKAAIKG